MSKVVSFFWSSIKIGVLGWGGGSALIPLIEKEFVDNKQFVTEEEYNNAVFIASITPGPLPVEIISLVGYQVAGRICMIIAPLLMALPGVFATIIILRVISQLSELILEHINLVMTGVSTYVVFLQIKYIYESLKKSKNEGIISKHLSASIIVFFLSFIVGISAIDIWISFICIFIIQQFNDNRYSNLLKSLVVIASLLLKEKSLLIGILYYFIMACVLFLSIRRKTLSVKYNQLLIKEIFFDVICWLSILIICCIPAILCIDNSLQFILKGIISSIFSVGGGDAYLNVAANMFVSNQIVSTDFFYSELVPIANLLPGSILCKVLSGIGYYNGYCVMGKSLYGYLCAIAGFASAVIPACLVCLVVSRIVTKAIKRESMIKFNFLCRVVVTGLLSSVSISLLEKNCFGSVGRLFICIIVFVVLIIKNISIKA